MLKKGLRQVQQQKLATSDDGRMKKVRLLQKTVSSLLVKKPPQELTKVARVNMEKKIQTDLSGEDLEIILTSRNIISEKLQNETKFKRKFFMQEVTKNVRSVSFNTSVQSVECLVMLFN